MIQNLRLIFSFAAHVKPSLQMIFKEFALPTKNVRTEEVRKMATAPLVLDAVVFFGIFELPIFTFDIKIIL